MAPKTLREEHDAFKKDFDDTHGVVEIQGTGGKYEYKWSEVLAELDPDAFKEEELQWHSSQKNKRKGGAAERLADDESRRNLEKLAVLCGRNRVIPFVGAGMSRDSGFELWGDFIKREARERRARKAQKLLGQGLYEDALEHLLEKAGAHLIQTAIDNTFGRSQITAKGPVKLLPHLFRTGIITTNFDGVLERVFADVHQVLEVRQGANPQDIIRMLKEGETCLLKLHGQGSSRDGRILSRSEYDQHYGPSGAVNLSLILPRTLSHAFQNMTLLFLGCSLASDRPLEVFKETMDAASKGGDTLPRHFAVLADPGSSARAGRRTSLAKLNIFPIFYRHKDPEDHSRAIHDILVSIQAHLEE